MSPANSGIIQSIGIADGEIERAIGSANGNLIGRSSGELDAVFSFEQSRELDGIAGVNIVSRSPELGNVQLALGLDGSRWKEISFMWRFEKPAPRTKPSETTASAETCWAKPLSLMKMSRMRSGGRFPSNSTRPSRRRVPAPSVRSVASMAEKMAACVMNGRQEAIIDDLEMIVVEPQGRGLNGDSERDGVRRAADLAGDGGAAITQNCADQLARGGDFERSSQGGDERDHLRAGEGQFRRTCVQETMAEGIDAPAIDVSDRTIGGDVPISTEQLDADHSAGLDGSGILLRGWSATGDSLLGRKAQADGNRRRRSAKCEA